jgi:hypothetical protein
MQTFLHLVHEYEFDLPDRFVGDPRTPATYQTAIQYQYPAIDDESRPFRSLGNIYTIV